MPTLYLSQPFMATMLNGGNAFNFFNGAAGTIFPNRLGHTGGDASVILNIYKGSMPANFTSFTDYATRAADLLVSFTLPTIIPFVGTPISWDDLGTVGTGDSTTRRYLIGRHPQDQAAAASGLATWFLLTQNFDTLLTNKAAIIGNVGLPGSGADLVIPNVNIAEGVNYQSLGLVINFAHRYNV